MEQKVEVTLNPSLEKVEATCCPKNPVPPVTRTRLRPVLVSALSVVRKLTFAFMISTPFRVISLARGKNRSSTSASILGGIRSSILIYFMETFFF